MEHALRGFGVPDNPIVDDSEESTQLHAPLEDGGEGLKEGTMDQHAGRRPYAVRVRMILLLSLLCWGVLLAGLAWILA